MRSIESLLNEICTEAREGPSMGCIDRCTTTELIEAQQEFPKLSGRPVLGCCTEDAPETIDPRKETETFVRNPELNKQKSD